TRCCSKSASWRWSSAARASPTEAAARGTYAGTVMTAPALDAIHAALATVSDPEIHRPITDLGMVKSVDVADDGSVDVGIYLTTQACPLRDRITNDVTAAVSKVPGVTAVRVDLDVMSDEQKQALRTSLQGGRAAR